MPLSYSAIIKFCFLCRPGAGMASVVSVIAPLVVEPIHPKTMPTILTTDEERDVWMRGR
jgi:hypothetical protein